MPVPPPDNSEVIRVQKLRSLGVPASVLKKKIIFNLSQKLISPVEVDVYFPEHVIDWKVDEKTGDRTIRDTNEIDDGKPPSPKNRVIKSPSKSGTTSPNISPKVKRKSVVVVGTGPPPPLPPPNRTNNSKSPISGPPSMGRPPPRGPTTPGKKRNSVVVIGKGPPPPPPPQVSTPHRGPSLPMAPRGPPSTNPPRLPPRGLISPQAPHAPRGPPPTNPSFATPPRGSPTPPRELSSGRRSPPGPPPPNTPAANEIRVKRNSIVVLGSGPSPPPPPPRTGRTPPRVGRPPPLSGARPVGPAPVGSPPTSRGLQPPSSPVPAPVHHTKSFVGKKPPPPKSPKKKPPPPLTPKKRKANSPTPPSLPTTNPPAAASTNMPTTATSPTPRKRSHPPPPPKPKPEDIASKSDQGNSDDNSGDHVQNNKIVQPLPTSLPPSRHRGSATALLSPNQIKQLQPNQKRQQPLPPPPKGLQQALSPKIESSLLPPPPTNFPPSRHRGSQAFLAPPDHTSTTIKQAAFSPILESDNRLETNTAPALPPPEHFPPPRIRSKGYGAQLAPPSPTSDEDGVWTGEIGTEEIQNDGFGRGGLGPMEGNNDRSVWLGAIGSDNTALRKKIAANNAGGGFISEDERVLPPNIAAGGSYYLDGKRFFDYVMESGNTKKEVEKSMLPPYPAPYPPPEASPGWRKQRVMSRYNETLQKRKDHRNHMKLMREKIRQAEEMIRTYKIGGGEVGSTSIEKLEREREDLRLLLKQEQAKEQTIEDQLDEEERKLGQRDTLLDALDSSSYGEVSAFEKKGASHGTSLIDKIIAKIKSRRHRSKIIQKQLQRNAESHAGEMNNLTAVVDDLVFRLAEAKNSNDATLAARLREEVAEAKRNMLRRQQDYDNSCKGLEMNLEEEYDAEELLQSELVDMQMQNNPADDSTGREIRDKQRAFSAHPPNSPPPSLIQRLLSKMSLKKRKSNAIKKEMRRVEKEQMDAWRAAVEKNRVLQRQVVDANHSGDVARANELTVETMRNVSLQQETHHQFEDKKGELAKQLEEEEAQYCYMVDELHALQSHGHQGEGGNVDETVSDDNDDAMDIDYDNDYDYDNDLDYDNGYKIDPASKSSRRGTSLMARLLAAIKKRRHNSKVVKKQLQRVEESHKKEMERMRNANEELLNRLAEANRNNDKIQVQLISERVADITQQQEEHYKKWEKERDELERNLYDEETIEESLRGDLSAAQQEQHHLNPQRPHEMMLQQNVQVESAGKVTSRLAELIGKLKSIKQRIKDMKESIRWANKHHTSKIKSFEATELSLSEKMDNAKKSNNEVLFHHLSKELEDVRELRAAQNNAHNREIADLDGSFGTEEEQQKLILNELSSILPSSPLFQKLLSRLIDQNERSRSLRAEMRRAEVSANDTIF